MIINKDLNQKYVRLNAFQKQNIECHTQSRQSGSPNWGPPPPNSEASVPPPPGYGGGDTLACGRGGRVPMPTRGQTL
jgi:hypothetical protein